MAGFRHYFSAFPGLTELSAIESVNVVDEPPPSTPLGAGSGVMLLVGEFEKGPLEAPTRIFGGADLETTFGGLGWADQSGAPHRYAVASKSAGATYPWNGNGWMELRNKRHSGLIITRVDGSAGSVQMSRLACLSGGKAPFNLEPGEHLDVSVDGAAAVVATFNATAAQLNATGATYPTGFTGGQTLEVSIDGAPTQVVTFTAADQSLAQVVARINSAVAATIASDNAGQLRLSSVKRGWGATIEAVGGTARATLGLPTAATQQVMTMTITAAGTTAAWSASFQQLINGVTTTYTANYTSDASPTTTEVRDGLYLNFLSLGVPNATFAPSGAAAMTVTMAANKVATSPTITPGGGGTGTFTTTTPAVLTKVEGTGNVQDIDKVSQAEFVTIVGALTGVAADADADGNARICNDATPATGTISVSFASTATGLGFTYGASEGAGTDGLVGTIPAGTLLQDSVTLAYWITILDVAVTEDNGGPYQVKVRPALDDDTAPTAAAGDLDTIVSTLYTGFSCNNSAAISRLNAAQMDARYQTAIDATIDVAGIAFDANTIRSARKSAAIQTALKANALAATASGHRARKSISSPPIGTTRATAQGSTGVGVGANRDQRNFYVFPGFRTLISEIAEVGVAGGTGFTADGLIDMPGDGFYASVRSILPPEENAGQQLSDTNYGALGAVGLEAAYDKSLGGIGLTEDDYKAFKAAGIIAPRVDRSAGLIFQSDVTSVQPATQPALADAKRRFFTDFLSDSLMDIGVSYSKKLNTPRRRAAFLATVNGFLELLKSSAQPDSSRLEDYVVRDETTTTQRGLGFQILRVAVRQHASMDFIVFRLTSGTTVNVEEI